MLKSLLPKRRGDVNMTDGNIFRHIIDFAIPLLFGNILQQLYNMVDTWVVGNYVSNEAFAAVGSVGPIINVLIGTFMGFASGAGVVISHYYGARDEDSVSTAVHTSMVVTLIFGVIFTALGILIAPYMVAFMKTPENVVPVSVEYLTIYFSGVIGLVIYNMGAGILRAVGDSQKPFIFIAICAIVNTVLDLVFVLIFDMGVAGVALATVIAQCTSGVLVVIELLRTKSCIKLSVKKLKVNFEFLKKIVRIGIPSALQMMITSFSNVFVQSYINYFGDNCMSGYTAYNKIDQILLIPIQSVSLATTTFVGQNLGVGKTDRAKRGLRTSLSITLVTTATMMIPVLIFAPQLVGFFNGKAEVVEIGAMFLRIISPFYIVCCVDMIFASALRGAGNPKVPMFIMIGSYVVFRQIYLFVVSNFISNTIVPIIMAYPAGWLVALIANLIYYKIKGLSPKNITSKAEEKGT